MAFDARLLFILNSFAGTSRIFDALVIFFAAYLQYVLGAAFLLLLSVSALGRRGKMRLFATTILSAGTARFGIVEIIRFLYHRPRPFMAYQLHTLLSDTEWSFPSGHSAFFFAMAASIYFYNKKWGIGFFIAALFMNMSRIIAGIHYPSDILGGMIIGLLTSCTFFYLIEKKRIADISRFVRD